MIKKKKSIFGKIAKGLDLYNSIGEEKMKDLISTSRQVLVGEDDDKEEPGTQGDKAEYQKKRKAIAKKFGVGDCSQLSGAKMKACYTALDKAHVADHEEQVELKNMKKEDTQKSFSKVFSHLKGMMKEKKKKMLKGYSSNY